MGETSFRDPKVPNFSFNRRSLDPARLSQRHNPFAE
jgi:hypothetical protein